MEEPLEPHKLRRWKKTGTAEQLNFYTCARPGRSKGKTGWVGDAVVSKWVLNLPGAPGTAIVSLLGRKPPPRDQSEFSFYSFCGGWDTPDERRGKLTFQQWLTRFHPTLKLEILEHPTFDIEPIPTESLAAIKEDVHRLLEARKMVVLVDLGGVKRSDQVCKYLALVEASRSL